MRTLFGVQLPESSIANFKSWFLARCLPDCPMPRWIPAVEMLPDTARLEQCALEWRELVRAGFDEWRKTRP